MVLWQEKKYLPFLICQTLYYYIFLLPLYLAVFKVFIPFPKLLSSIVLMQLVHLTPSEWVSSCIHYRQTASLPCYIYIIHNKLGLKNCYINHENEYLTWVACSVPNEKFNIFCNVLLVSSIFENLFIHGLKKCKYYLQGSKTLISLNLSLRAITLKRMVTKSKVSNLIHVFHGASLKILARDISLIPTMVTNMSDMRENEICAKWERTNQC